jgi:hypothetical protein
MDEDREDQRTRDRMPLPAPVVRSADHGEAPKKQRQHSLPPAKRGRPAGPSLEPTAPTPTETKELLAMSGSAGVALQGVLWLTVGMPLIIKRNIDQQHGLCTGVRATLVRVQLAEGDTDCARSCECATHSVDNQTARVRDRPSQSTTVRAIAWT